MSTKKRLLIGIGIAAVAAVIIIVVFNMGSTAYNYDMSEYVKLDKKNYIGVEIEKVKADKVTYRNRLILLLNPRQRPKTRKRELPRRVTW